MTTDARGFPVGELRVSDADRDRARSELSDAVRVGRITAASSTSDPVRYWAPAPGRNGAPRSPACPSMVLPMTPSPSGEQVGHPPGSPSARRSPPRASPPSR
jgi:hypothetical protein